MDVIEAAEQHIKDYKDLKERHATLLKNYETIEKWLAVAIGKSGGKIELLAGETFEQFQIGGGVAFGGRECHYFDYYNAAPTERREQATFGAADVCAWPRPCPHCNDELLFDVDRGIHCDGCDDLTADDIDRINAEISRSHNATAHRESGEADGCKEDSK
jgi:hypothetical protein